MEFLKRVVKRYAWLLVALFLSAEVQATHLMGGNLAYEYLGLNGSTGLYDYRVTLTIYRLCDPGSSQLPNFQEMGAYQDNPGNPGGNKDILATVNLPLISQQFITPPNANDSCTFLPSVCVEEGVYQAIISVPANTTGYYFIADRCCRNNNIANVDNAGGTGQAYFASVPPPTVVNSSPTFAVAPVPFICANDTVSVLNQAFDVNGDSLVYNFVTPYWGISDNINSAPNPPNSYTWPVPDIVYAAGYSVTSPFGAGGYISIDNTSGLASYVSPNQGFYVVAVEIAEYRNGVLIGITRRDIQLIVINCPSNPAPTLTTGSTATSFTIQEGQTLCFNVAFTDPNGDSLFMTPTGDVFNSAIVNPPATLSSAAGPNNISSQFCWTTACGQGRSTPYQFTAIVSDNGCPAKTTNVVYTINVQPAQQPSSIVGPDSICANAASAIPYSVSGISGYTYNWLVNNGSQVSGGTTAAAGVSFNNVGNATVSVIATNPFGCPADTVNKAVVIKALPAANAGSDISFCSGSSLTIGGPSSAGVSYSWTPATGLSSSTVSNPTVTISNGGGTPQSTTYILTTSQNGCSNADTVEVTANPFPIANAGSNISICSGNSAPLGSLPTSGFIYTWSPASGLNNTTIANPSLTLTTSNSTPDTLEYVLIVENSFGCKDTDTVQVIVRPVPTALAGSDITFCSGASGNIGSGATANYTYSWSPSTGLGSSTSSATSVTLTTTQTTNDTIPYVVTTSLFGCIDRDTVNVVVRPNPVSNAGSDLNLCSGLTGQLGTTSTAGYVYNWSPASGLSGSTISNPQIILSNVTSTPDTNFYVVTTTLNGCTTSDSVRVIVSPVPTAVAGGDQTICSGQSIGIGSASTPGYAYTWTPTTGLSSSTISNPVSSATNSGTSPLVINYAVIANWFGCRDTDSVAVTINPLPVSNAGTNQLLCTGSTVNLGTGTTAGYTYVWTPSGGLSSTVISNPTLTLNIAPGATDPDTLFYVVTTTLNGCTTSDSVQVVLSPVPTAAAGNDVLFCSGQTVSIGTSSVSGYAYSWSPSSGLSSASSAQPNLTLTNGTLVFDTVTYVITVNWFGCIDRDTIEAVVKPLPVSEAGSNTVLCDGDTLTLGAASTVGYTYVWSPGTGLSSTVSSSPLLTVSNPGPGVVSQYYTVTTTWNGCTSRDSANITINPLPVVATTASQNPICFGQSTIMTASGANSYNWALLTSPGTSIGTGAALNVSPGVTTSYLVTGTSSATCVNTDTITITVNQLPNVAISAANDTICDGDTIQLNAGGASTYTWIVQGGGSAGTGTSISVSPSATTTYILNGTDANLCNNSDTITITVNPAATITGISGTVSLCPGVTGVPYWVNNPNSTSTYSWTVQNGIITGGQGNDTIYVDWDTAGAGNVTVIEITDRGCQSDPIVLPTNINVILTPAAPTGPTTLCANQAQSQVYSSINTPGSVYNWFANGGTIVNGNGTSTVTVDWNITGPAIVALWYEETSTTLDTVCFGVSDTIYVSISPVPQTSAISGNSSICESDTGLFNVINTTGSTYQWTITGGAVLTGNGSNSISANWTGSGAAVVSVTETNSYGCTGNPVTYNVTVNPLPPADAGTNATICSGDSASLQASGGTSYSWSPSTGLDNPGVANPYAFPTATTTYTVLVTDGNGCKNTDDVIVFVNPLPIVSAGSNTAICIGTPTTLNASGGVNYSWSPTTGLSDPLIFNPQANPSATTIYTVVATDANGCSNSSSVTVTVNALPVADAGIDTILCNGNSVPLSATGGVSYAWSPTSGLNNPNISNPLAGPSAQTLYTVVVTDINGCTDDDQVLVDINPQPQALFELDTTKTVVNCDGIRIKTVNLSSDAMEYNWSFGDGNTSTNDNPAYQYPFGANVNLVLIASNNFCTDTMSMPLNFEDLEGYIKGLPNTFTPNGDEINDCFDLRKKLDFEECSVWKVYNRWGELIFESTSGEHCWNGRRKGDGDPCPVGTYFYILKVKDAGYKGTINLLR